MGMCCCILWVCLSFYLQLLGAVWNKVNENRVSGPESQNNDTKLDQKEVEPTFRADRDV